MADGSAFLSELEHLKMPAIITIEGEDYMRLLDVLRFLQPGSINGRDAHSLLMNFKALAPPRRQEQWGKGPIFDTRLRLIKDRSAEVWEDFRKIDDGDLEYLRINVGWAGRIIEAVRKGKDKRITEATREHRPWRRLFGKSAWVARVLTEDRDVFFHL